MHHKRQEVSSLISTAVEFPSCSNRAPDLLNARHVFFEHPCIAFREHPEASACIVHFSNACKEQDSTADLFPGHKKWPDACLGSAGIQSYRYSVNHLSGCASEIDQFGQYNTKDHRRKIPNALRYRDVAGQWHMKLVAYIEHQEKFLRCIRQYSR